MTHPRKLVRDAFAAQILGLPTTGARVFKYGRRVVSGGDQVPCARVVITGDGRESDALVDTVLPETRVIRIECEVVARALDEVEDLVDQACAEIEDAIAADTTLGGAVQYCVYQDARVDVDYSAQQATYVVTMNFEALV